MRQNSQRRLSVMGGFTIVELAVTIAIAAILAAFAAATINIRVFDTEGVADRGRAAVRYAQKLAISQRRNVSVTIAGNAISLTYPDAPLSGAAVRDPADTVPFVVSKSGIAITGSSFTFDSLGRPSAGGTITITGDGSRTITVEAETGYVR